ncbi:MAG: hypothetical protein WBP38_14140 [Hyphomicrobium sp.]
MSATIRGELQNDGRAHRRSILVGSPIRQRPQILEAFLGGLTAQFSGSLDLTFVFVDDNDDQHSKELLKSFREGVQNVILADVDPGERYVCDDSRTHVWKESLIWRVAAMKDVIIDHALETEADYLFLVDSDIVLRPGTIEHLASLDLDVVSEVFWTKWTPESLELPQVWLYDVYDMVRRGRSEQLDELEAVRRRNQFIEMLRRPGVYPVGGLGACTLISRSAMERGVRFREIPNLQFWGEDRHFCIRAAALEIGLWADTHLPPLHLYRESDLQRLPDFEGGASARILHTHSVSVQP